MKKQAIVVGLGNFGLSVARALTERDIEVLAVDVRDDRVRAAASFAAEAACFDATDAEALARAAPDQREVCVCAIGDASKDSSIICTALLRQMGAPRVIARADDDVHARILKLVGAHQVVNPQREFGERLASQIRHESIMGELPLGKDLFITEFRPPSSFVGHSLAELALPARYGVTVVAIREPEREGVTLPAAQDPLREGDVLIVVAKEGAVAELLRRS